MASPRGQKMDYAPVLFQGSLMAFDMAEVTMKVCCCVASLGTFKRLIDIQEIPQMFLCLPSLLLILFAIQKFTQLKEDPTTLAMVTGALIGVITGFLSGIDKIVQPDVPDTLSGQAQKSPVVYNLEILHIPVVFGAVMYSFCMVFDRLPAGNKLKWAGMVGLCGAVICTMYRSTVFMSSRYRTNGASHLTFFAVMMLAFFLIGLFPTAKPGQQAWIVCVVAWMIQLLWQSSFFDNLLWNWADNQFPIPGFLTGMIIIFFGDVLVSTRTTAALAKYHQKSWTKVLGKEPLEPMLNAFLWHSVTFIVQKISLYVIQQKNRSGAFIPSYTLEATITFIISMFFLYVVSSNLRATPVMRIFIIILTLIYYILQGLTSLSLPNGFFVDIILGLAIIYSVQIHHIEHMGER